MKKLLIILGVVAGLFVLSCVGLTVAVALMGDAPPEKPGEVEFETANRLIGRNTGTAARGNTPAAEAIAAEFSTGLKTARAVLFTSGKKGAVSLTDGEFLTYCQLNRDSSVFLVHVPELRRFEKDAKRSLGEIAWISAQASLKDRTLDPDHTLVVALRGAAIYGPILIGPAGGEPPAASEGRRDVLYPFFLPAGPAGATPATPLPTQDAESNG